MSDSNSLFTYDNYRVFLKDFYVRSKAENKNFSFRYFARLAGIQSSSFLKKVIDGERNLSEEGIHKFAKALKLNKEETMFFKNLVFLNQATSSEEKFFFSREILRSRTFKKLYPVRESQLRYLSEWYYIPIREMVALPQFRDDPEWISKRLKPSVPPENVKEAIEELIQIGLLNRDTEGKLFQAHNDVVVPDQITSSYLAHSHRELIKKAGESIDRFPSQRREVTAVTMKLSAQSLKRIKEIVQNFRNDMRAEAAKDDHPDAIYQVTLQIFPLAELGDEKDESK